MYVSNNIASWSIILERHVGTSSTLSGICQEVIYLTRPYLHLNKSKKKNSITAKRPINSQSPELSVIVLLLYNKTPLSPYLSGFWNPYIYLSRRNFYSEKKPNYISDTASQSPVGLCLKIRYENLTNICQLITSGRISTCNYLHLL